MSGRSEAAEIGSIYLSRIGECGIVCSMLLISWSIYFSSGCWVVLFLKSHAVAMDGVMHCSGRMVNTQQSDFVCFSKTILLQWMQDWFTCLEYCVNWMARARYIILNSLWEINQSKPWLGWSPIEWIFKGWSSLCTSTCSLKCQQKLEETVHNRCSPMNKCCSLPYPLSPSLSLPPIPFLVPTLFHVPHPSL